MLHIENGRVRKGQSRSSREMECGDFHQALLEFAQEKTSGAISPGGRQDCIPKFDLFYNSEKKSKLFRLF